MRYLRLMTPDPATVSAQVAAIKVRTPDYWRDEPGFAEVLALWGGGHNDCGVFMHGERELVAQQGQASAEVIVAQSPSGLFAFGIRFSSPISGFGYAPSIWAEPFGSREEARNAAIATLLNGLGNAPRSYSLSKQNREDFDRMGKQLRAQMGPKQRGLFDL
jgi:hypothetical protein